MSTPLAISALNNSETACLAKRLALGLSVEAWPLLLRLLSKNHVDQLALTPSAASALDYKPNELIVQPASQIFQNHWNRSAVLIVVGSLGAITRLIAPLLINKEEDPAILVMDSQAKQVIPLIGGHQADAENLAIQLAADFDSQPIITGSCSNQGRLAFDCFGEAWGWKRRGNKNDWSQFMIGQAKGLKLIFDQQSGSKLWQTVDAASLAFKELQETKDSDVTRLNIGPYKSNPIAWHPPTLWIGIGCERKTSFSLLERSLINSLNEGGFAQEAIAGIATINFKQDEDCLVALSRARNLPMRLFSVEELSKTKVPNPSKIVEDEIGTPSVSEAAAILAASKGAWLVQPKKVYKADLLESGAVTIAIAQSKDPYAPHLGEIHLVGSGPGDLSLLTHDSRRALARSVVWIGYDLYLDLLEPLRRPDQARVNSKLTFEKKRCMEALRLAQQGIRVAMISSGDAGIYGMAGLLLELWLQEPIFDRPLFQVHPGLSAFQVAAARVGAPLMHDFCTVSLSDRLTSWSKIELRLESAAQGDFVVALFNPRSNNRTWQLQRAIDIFLKYRSPSTPTVFARQIGRSDEDVKIFTLATLPFEEVDMLTLILIGNSSTRFQDEKIVTPRGYDLENSC